MIFVVEDVTMEDEGSFDHRVAKIHQQDERAGRAVRVPMRNQLTIGPEGMRNLDAVDLLDEKVQLMDMKVVGLRS